MKKFYAILLLSSLLSCGSDERPSIPTDVVAAIKAIDLDNTHTANDIRIQFTLNDISTTTEVRIVLIKSGDEQGLNTSSAAGLDSQNYYSIESTKLKNEFRLDSNQRDMSGAALVINQEYKVKVILVKENDLAIADNETTITLLDVSPQQGMYTGTWSDQLYNKIPISGELTEQNGVLTGQFYFTAVFTSAYAGKANDGSWTIELDGKDITSFSFNQVIDNCGGLYTGTGKVLNNANLDINFTGNDCEGPHTGGKILLTRV